MRLVIHHRIGKHICSELKELGCKINERLFLFGNLFPDLNQSYLWCRHEYQYSRDYIRKKLNHMRKKPWFFSFRLGVLTHYICDYFCYPHSSGYDKGLFQHILYEIRQKVPEKLYNTKISVAEFSILELDSMVESYEIFRSAMGDDESDVQIAVMMASSFLQTAY